MIDDTALATEIVAWYEGKSFTSDWTSKRFPLWTRILARYRDVPLNVLEIGSWEGRSALFFLNYLPRCRLVCVDTFAGSEEHFRDPTLGGDRVISEVEQRFDANLADFADRIEKVKSASQVGLLQLGMSQRSFDLAYIDGSHYAADVYSDGILTWPLMVQGGTVIFDDYLWDGRPEPFARPKNGIDHVLQRLEGQYRVIDHAYQIVIEKCV